MLEILKWLIRVEYYSLCKKPESLKWCCKVGKWNINTGFPVTVWFHIFSVIYNYVIVIPQYEHNILVITQVQGEDEDAGNN